ncbi:MAG TPA: DUF1684 domain-containing protein [Steroidobacteraceae bacterium]|nr:DUF1684 domain-containing protein [Steroidobacteraceae bacterium]
MLKLTPLLVAALAAVSATATDLHTERASVEKWRTERVTELTNETGWLTLVGLYWLSPGENTFGRAPSNTLVLDHPSLADTAGTFTLTGSKVTFTARPGSGITHGGRPVTSIELVSDANDSPTVVSSGPLRFFVIERAGKFGVRVRDVASPRRRDFAGLHYFPIAPDWVFNARFEPYEPRRQIMIVNILGLEDDMVSPGALVFTKDGQEIRLDAVLDGADATDLFVMFADGTSGHDTYGAGRFLHVPFATDGKTVVDFNKAYNPPCAFNDFATCPLPPYQNRVKLKITAGEKKYVAAN